MNSFFHCCHTQKKYNNYNFFCLLALSVTHYSLEISDLISWNVLTKKQSIKNPALLLNANRV